MICSSPKDVPRTQYLSVAMSGIEFMIDIHDGWAEVTFWGDGVEIGDFLESIHSSGPKKFVISDLEKYGEDGMVRFKILKVGKS